MRILNDYLNSKDPKPKGDKFDKLNQYLNSKDPSGSVSLGSTDTYHNYGQDITNDDYLPDDYSYASPYDTDELRAQRQPWIHKAGAGIARVGVKVGAEIAKMPGVVGGVIGATAGQIEDGISGEDNTDFMQTAFNNAWIKGVNNANEWVNKEALPVYVRKAVEEGNLWDNITSVDFWATEGADGVGYILSMLAPGAALNKLGLGQKIFSGLGKYRKILDSTDNAVNALSKAGKGGRLPITPEGIDLWSQTAANTLFEAAAEAQGAMDATEMQLKEQLNNGEITEEEFKNRIGEVGRDVFLSNAAILVGPNAIMSKMLWGKTRNKTPKGRFGDDGRLQEIARPGIGKRSLNLLGDLTKASAREGFFEEGMQSTAEEYFVHGATTGESQDVGDFARAYIDMLGTTDGQKAIFLGSVLGGGMQAWQGSKARKNERESANKLIGLGNTAFDNMYSVFSEDIYVKDKEGNVQLGENGKPQIDEVKLQKKIESSNELEQISAQYDLAVEEGNKDMVESIRDEVSTHTILPFLVNENLGLNVLRDHLEQSEEMANIAEREGTSKKDITDKIMAKAEKLKEAYSAFQEFAPSLIKLEDPKATPEQVQDYYNRLSVQYVQAKARQMYVKDLMQKNNKLYIDVLAEKNITKDQLEDKAFVELTKSRDKRVDKLSTTLEQLNKADKQLQDIIEAFWDDKSSNKAFSRSVKNDAAIAKKFDEKNKKEAEEALNKIKGAKTEDDLSNINVSSENPASPEIEKQKEARRKEFQKAKEEQLRKQKEKGQAKQAEQQEQDKATETEFEKIYRHKGIGDRVTIAPTLSKDYANKDGEITAKDENEGTVTIKLDEGSEITLSKDNIKTTPSTHSVEEDFSTEGGVNHSPQQPEFPTKEDKEGEKGGAKIISIYNNGTPIPWVAQQYPEYLEFEREPRNKTGEKVSFTVNRDRTNLYKDFWQKALDIYDKYEKQGNFNGITEKERKHLYAYLPMQSVFKGNVVAPMETLPDENNTTQGKKAQENFTAHSLELRKAIIDAMILGTNISDIQGSVQDQFKGLLQVAPKKDGKVVENNILDLHYVNGDLGKIKLYMVNRTNDLQDVEGNTIAANISGKGEIYLSLPRANGEMFPLKLNVRKITQTEAEGLFKLYQLRMLNDKVGKLTTMSELSKEDQQYLKETFGPQIDVIKKVKSVRDIVLKDLTDFMIWDGTTSVKSQVRLEGANLLFGNNKVFRDKMEDPAVKEDFIHFLTIQKRHHIKFKSKKNDTLPLTVNNKHYLEYLVKTGILNTNAVVNEPTFQGRTHIYLNKSISVKGQKQQKPNTPTVDTSKMSQSEILDKINNELHPLKNARFKELQSQGVSARKATLQVEEGFAKKQAELEAKYKVGKPQEVKPERTDKNNSETVRKSPEKSVSLPTKKKPAKGKLGGLGGLSNTGGKRDKYTKKQKDADRDAKNNANNNDTNCK